MTQWNIKGKTKFSGVEQKKPNKTSKYGFQRFQYFGLKKKKKIRLAVRCRSQHFQRVINSKPILLGLVIVHGSVGFMIRDGLGTRTRYKFSITRYSDCKIVFDLIIIIIVVDSFIRINYCCN